MSLVAEHKVSPYEVLPLGSVLRWTLGAAVKGSPGVLRDFLAVGRRGAAVARDLKIRRALLADAHAVS